MSLSIRGRLILGIVSLVACGLAIATVSGVVLLRAYLIERADSQLVGLPTAGQPPNGDFDICSQRRPVTRTRIDVVITVLNADGSPRCSVGARKAGRGPDVPHLTYQETAAQTDLLRTVPSIDGSSRWRIHATALPSSHQTVVVALSLADADATVSRLAHISVVTSTIILAATALGGYLIAGLGLRPLHRIEETAKRIADGDLAERVPEYRANTEVGRLSSSLNGMLNQIERAFSDRASSEERLRQFIADASHELRTPLATIRGHAELHRTGVATSTDDVAMVLTRVESEAIRMGALVDDMLLLANLDQARPLQQGRVDLLAIAADTIVDAHARQPGRRITLESTGAEDSPPPVVTGDQARLRQVVINLVSNALRHTPEDSVITVRVGSHDHQAVVEVEDAGPGMPAAVVERVFQRFYRGEGSRTRELGGTGLGLAIVDALVTAHGGTATCRSQPGRATTFTISIPLEGTTGPPGFVAASDPPPGAGPRTSTAGVLSGNPLVPPSGPEGPR